MVHEAEELSCMIAESGTNTDTLLASRLILEGLEPTLFADLGDNNTYSLSTHIDRLNSIGDIATAETLQRSLVVCLIKQHVCPNLVAKEITKHELFHTQHIARVARLLKGLEVNIEPYSLCTPLFHYPDFLKHEDLVSAMTEN